MNNGKKCIGVFLDIQGAFDTIDPKYITQELKKHTNESDLIAWYFNYLTHRNLTSDIGGHTGTVYQLI